MSGRLPRGGRIDRSRAVRFTFDGGEYEGFAGDTLASALMASGVDVIATSVKRGRPRGIFSAGIEEPNAIVHLEAGSDGESMLPATQIELVEGLVARSLGGRGLLGRPPAATREEGPFDKAHAHCDVLVIGGGPAGLAAAWSAGRTGARVILVDQESEFGGQLLGSGGAFERIDGRPAVEWVDKVVNELAAMPEVRLLARATALGWYDANYVTVAERRTEHLGIGEAGRPAGPARRRLWHIRAARIVLATGAHERPLAFEGNDLPGVMLAASARTYVNRFGALPGRAAVVLTVTDSAYAAALDLAGAGLEVRAIVDARTSGASAGWTERAREAGIEVIVGSGVVRTDGDVRLSGVWVRGLAADGRDRAAGPRRRLADDPSSTRFLGCDLLAVSGGWSPVAHLWTHTGGTLRYEERIAAFVPDTTTQAGRAVGAARGVFGLAEGIAEGLAAGADAAARTGFGDGSSTDPLPVDGPDRAPLEDHPAEPIWMIPGEAGGPSDWSTHFVDLQRDVTVADVARAIAAGLGSIEHIKRHTLIGTANDQGKTSGMLTIGIAADLLRVSPADLGTTTFRPPFAPVAFGLLAGRERGRLFDPIRVTPMHPWHVANGAVFEAVGQWHRARYYPGPGEDMETAVLRECRAAREGVAVTDVSTLGKIDIQGADAGAFLDRVYTNTFSTLAVGRARYGLMLKLDGMVFDDGVTTRLADDHFHMTTTTGNAAAVLDWLEEWLQTEWPDLDVRCTSVTEQWAVAALVGPGSRELVSRLAPAMDLSPTALPFMAMREGLVAGIPARVFRISFSGELAYEVNVASWSGLALWEALMTAGREAGITPYGTEAIHVLRAEKGYVIVGQETDGTVTPLDLGLEGMLSRSKDFLGGRSLRRPAMTHPDRRQLVGLLASDPTELLPEGAQLVRDPSSPTPIPMVGHVTSSYRSAALGRTIALALVKGGRGLLGQTVYAPLPGRTIAATICPPVFVDPENERRDG